MTKEEFINWFEGFTLLTPNDIYELGQLYDEVTKPHWISVKKELPKKKGWILICSYSDVDMWYYDGQTAKDLIDYASISHWMPLPMLPKEGGEK